MSQRDTFRFLFVPGTVWFLVEVYSGFFLGSALPLPTWYFLLSLGLIGLLSVLLVELDRRAGGRLPVKGSFGWVVLAWLVVLGKLVLVGGVGDPLPFLWLSLPFLALMVRTHRAPESPGTKVFGLLTVLLAAIVSTDVVHVTWSLSRGVARGSLLAGLTIAVLGTAVLVLGHRLAGAAAAGLKNAGRGVLYALLGAVVLVGLLWAADRRPADWERRPAFSGSLPEVHSAKGVSGRERPNIIVLSVDALRRDHVTPPFPEDLQVPHLRNLRRDSVRLKRTYTSSTLTLPAQASLLSGEPPPDHGILGRPPSAIAAHVPLFSQYLRRAGYATAAFTGGGRVGRKHGFLRGFDRFWEQPTPYGRFVPGAVELTAAVLSPTPYSFPVRYRDHGKPPPRPARPLLSRAEDWLRARDRADSPAFAFLHTRQISDYDRPIPDVFDRLKKRKPNLAGAFQGEDTRGVDLSLRLTDRERRSLITREPFMNDTSWERFQRRMDALGSRRWHERILRQVVRLYPPDLRTLQKASIANAAEADWINLVNLSNAESEFVLNWQKISENLQTITPETLRGRRWLYRRELERFDRALGTFLDNLRDDGLYEDSLIVLVSGHGEGFSWDPLVLGHGLRSDLTWEGQVNEPLLRVPLWIKLPRQTHTGSASGGTVQITDVLPMVIRHVGLTASRWPDGDAGLRLRGLLEESGPLRRRAVVGVVPSGKRLEPKYFVQAGRYRYVVNAPLHTTYFRAVRKGGSAEPFISTGTVPTSTRRILRRRMLERLKREVHGWENSEYPKPRHADFIESVVRSLESPNPTF